MAHENDVRESTTRRSVVRWIADNKTVVFGPIAAVVVGFCLTYFAGGTRAQIHGKIGRDGTIAVQDGGSNNTQNIGIPAETHAQLQEKYDRTRAALDALVTTSPLATTLRQQALEALDKKDLDRALRLIEEAVAADKAAVTGLKEILSDRECALTQSIGTNAQVSYELGEYHASAAQFKDASDAAEPVSENLRATYLRREVLARIAAGESRGTLKTALVALRTHKRLLGHRDEETASSVGVVASAYQALGNYDRAEVHYARALRVAPSSLYPEKRFDFWDGLSDIYLEQRRYNDAEHASAMAWAAATEAQKPIAHYPRPVRHLIRIAQIMLRENRYDAAEQYCLRAAEAIARRGEPPDAQRAEVFWLLSALAGAQRRYEEAVQYGQRALAIDEGIFGGNHPIVARDLEVIAAAELGSHNYWRAEALLNRQIKISELDTDRTNLAASLANLVVVSRTLGKFADAETAIERWRSVVSSGSSATECRPMKDLRVSVSPKGMRMSGTFELD